MAVQSSKPTTFCEQLLQAVETVDSPGAVCTCGDLPLTMPGLEVENVGPIRLPLGKAQARQLIKQCRQAPYGKGTQTLVDTEVRRVWELDPEQFQFTNPQWEKLVRSLTQQVQEALGLEQSKLQANLYKLLVYEAGGFFLAHRDGEKLDGMVATLVIVLPSPHAGGELIVTHEGRRHELHPAGAASGHELSYAAFYADCEHEVLPIRDGYRLCLTYNLTLARRRPKVEISTPRTAGAVTALSELLQSWPQGAAARKAAVALAHHYTQDGLRFDALKGIDRARAEALFEAAEQAGCAAYLALMTHWQSGSAEDGYDDYYRRGRRRRWAADEDEEDDQAPTRSRHTMGEIFDESLTLDHWSDRAGQPVPFGEFLLDEEEIVADKSREAWQLGREDYEGYTGNEGMTLERWYHRAAVVLWPKQNHFAVLCEAGASAAIAGLGLMVKQLKGLRKPAKETQRDACLKFAGAIIDSWAPPKFSYFDHRPQPQDQRASFAPLLETLDDVELMERYVSEIMPQDPAAQVGKGFGKFCRRHGWSVLEPGLSKVVEVSTPATIQRNAALLEILCVKQGEDAQCRDLCRRLTDRLVEALMKIDGQPRRSSWEQPRLDHASLLPSLVKSLVAIADEETLARLIGHAVEQEKQYDLVDVHLAGIFGLETWLKGSLQRPSRAVADWLAGCRKRLEQRTAQPPARPADFRRASKLPCKCADCRQLSHFLDDPHQSVLKMPLAKQRRQHLHGIIDSHRCDVTHVTMRTGSPFTLVCTKTTASYDAACKIYKRDCEHLARLRGLEASLGAGT